MTDELAQVKDTLARYIGNKTTALAYAQISCNLVFPICIQSIRLLF